MLYAWKILYIFNLQNPTTSELWNELNASQTWNVEIFVQAVIELVKNKILDLKKKLWEIIEYCFKVPHISWKDIIKEFDYPEFYIKDKFGFRLIIIALKKGLKEGFPIEFLYRIWKNVEGQVSIFLFKNLYLFLVSVFLHLKKFYYNF